MNNYYVLIVEDSTRKIETAMGPMSERRADKVANGAGINLNWERFSVIVEQGDSAEDALARDGRK